MTTLRPFDKLRVEEVVSRVEPQVQGLNYLLSDPELAEGESKH